MSAPTTNVDPISRVLSDVRNTADRLTEDGHLSPLVWQIFHTRKRGTALGVAELLGL